MGKRKLEVAYRTDKLKRQKTFHDRKAGLFKKATEISVLCGCKVFIRVESEDGETFEFGEDSDSAKNGALVSTCFALPHSNNGSQQNPTDEIVSAQSSLDFPQISKPILEMEREKDQTHYSLSDDLHSCFSNQMNPLQEMFFTDVDYNCKLTPRWICSSQNAFLDSVMPL